MSYVHANRPFNVRYAIWQATGRYPADQLRTHRTARASWLYIHRRHGVDAVGPTPDWSTRDDLIASGRVGPARARHSALAGMALWDEADRYAREFRPDEPVCAHAVASLPVGMDRTGWVNLLVGFCEDHLASQGMITDWAIHQRHARDGEPAILPHAHLLITTRVYDPDSDDVGRIRQTWLRTAQARKALGDRWMAHSGMYPPALGRAA